MVHIGLGLFEGLGLGDTAASRVSTNLRVSTVTVGIGSVSALSGP
jgi:hypothetical protein